MAGMEIRQASVCETWWRLGGDSVEPQRGSFRGVVSMWSHGDLSDIHMTRSKYIESDPKFCIYRITRRTYTTAAVRPLTWVTGERYGGYCRGTHSVWPLKQRYFKLFVVS